MVSKARLLGMEVLVEINGSRRPLKPFTKESILELIRKHDKDAFLVLDNEDQAGNSPYILQRWSSKWKTFVDVSSLDEIEEHDKITIIPKPSSASEVSSKYASLLASCK